MAACHRPSARGGDADAAQATTATAAPAAPATAPANADAILAENDRIIAENQRMTAQLAAYGREDPDKLNRLSAACRARLGMPADADGARRNFACIKAGW